MSLIHVNKQKCKADGICTKVCPIEILKMDDAQGVPVAIENAEEMCINCGHCVSVCPHGALSLVKMPVKDLTELPADWRIQPDKLITFLKGRRSIRQYKNKEVPKENIEKLIDIARYAPTGLNKQPVRWTVVYAKDHTHKLVELVVAWMQKLIDLKSPMAESLRMDLTVDMWRQGKDRICRGAPHVILGHGLKEDMIAPQSTTIAFTYLELAAVSMGLGPCWAGYVNMAINSSEEVRKFLGLSARSACFGAMLLGFSKYEYKRIPLRNNPKIKWR
ncbi:MAG: nitroreductase family protein [Candidatus Omnitrophica bacterium]|nr:nitroreductase family protein [Candidatus Omnitrophota bacterium]